jgi:hypothetical protein
VQDFVVKNLTPDMLLQSRAALLGSRQQTLSFQPAAAAVA